MDPELLISSIVEGKDEDLVRDFVAYKDSSVTALTESSSDASLSHGGQGAVKLGNVFLKALSACNTRVTQSCKAQTLNPKRKLPVPQESARERDSNSKEWVPLGLARSSPFPQVRTADGPKRNDATVLQVAVAAVQGLDGISSHLVNGQHLVWTSRARVAKMFQDAGWHEEAQAEVLRLFLGISRDQAVEGKGPALNENRSEPLAHVSRRRAGCAGGPAVLAVQELEPTVFLRPPRDDDPTQLCALVVHLLQTLLFSCVAAADFSAKGFLSHIIAIVQQAVPFLLLTPEDRRTHAGENIARLLVTLSGDVAESDGASGDQLDSKSEKALKPALALFKEAIAFGRRFGNLPEAVRAVSLIGKRLGNHFTAIAELYEWALREEAAKLQEEGVAASEQWALLQLASRYTMKAYEGYFEGRAEVFLWRLQDEKELPEYLRMLLQLLVVAIKLGLCANGGVDGKPDGRVAASAGLATAAALQQVKQLVSMRSQSPAGVDEVDGAHTGSKAPRKQQRGSGRTTGSQTPADLWLSSVAVALGSVAFIVDDASVKLSKGALAGLGHSEDKGQAIWDGSNNRPQMEVAAAIGGTSTVESLQELLVDMFCVVQPLLQATSEADSQGARGQIPTLATGCVTAVRLAAIGLGSLKVVGQTISSRIPGKCPPPEALTYLPKTAPPIFKLGISFASAGQWSQAAALLGLALDMSNGAIEAAAPALWAAAASAHPSNESARAASEQLRQASQWYALICNSWKTAGRLSEYLIHIKDFKEADRMLEASIRRWWWCAAPVEPDPAASMDPEADQAKTVDLAPLHRLGYDWGEVQVAKMQNDLEPRFIHDLLLDGAWGAPAVAPEAKKALGKGKARRQNGGTDSTSARQAEDSEPDPLEAHAAAAVGRLMEEEFRAYERDAHYHPQASAAAQTAVLQALSQGVYAAGRCPLGRARALLDRARLLHASFAEQPAAVDGDQRLPHLQSLDEAILALDDWVQRQPTGLEPLSKPGNEEKQKRAKGVKVPSGGPQGPGPVPVGQQEGLSLMAAALCTRGLLQHETGKDCEGALSDIARSVSVWARLCERGGEGNLPHAAPALGGFQPLLVAATDLLRLEGSSSLPQALWVAAQLHSPGPASSEASAAPPSAAGPAAGWLQGYSHASHALCQAFTHGMWGSPRAHHREEEWAAALIPMKGRQLPRLDIVMQQSTLRYNLAWAAFSRNDSVKALHWAREGMRWRFILVCYILTEQSKTALLDKRDEKAGEAGPGHRGSSSTSFESAVASAASLLSGHSSYATASQHSLGSTVSSQATAESKDTGLGGEIKPGAGPRTVTLTAKQDALMRVLPSALSVAGYKAQSTKGAEGQEASSEVVKAPDPNQWQIIGDYLESLHQVGTLAELMGDADDARRVLLEGLLITSGLQLHYGTLLFASSLGEVFRKLQQWDEAEKHLNTASEALTALTNNKSRGMQADKGKAGAPGGFCCPTCLQLATARLAVCQGDLARRRSTAKWWQTGFLGSKSEPKQGEKKSEGAEDDEATSRVPAAHPPGPSAPASGAGRRAPKESIVAAYLRAESSLCTLVPAPPKGVSKCYDLAQRVAAVGVEVDEGNSEDESSEGGGSEGEASEGGGSVQEDGGAPPTLGEPVSSPSRIEAQGESSSAEAEEVGMLCIQLEKRFQEEVAEETKGKGRRRGRGKKDAPDDNSEGGSDSGDSWETASVGSVSSAAPPKPGARSRAPAKQAAGAGSRGANAPKQTAPVPAAKRPGRAQKVHTEKETGEAGPVDVDKPVRAKRASGRNLATSPVASIGDGHKGPTARKPPSRTRRGSQQALQATDEGDSSGVEVVEMPAKGAAKGRANGAAKGAVKGAAKGSSTATQGRPEASARQVQKSGGRGAGGLQAPVVLSTSGSDWESCATTPAPGPGRQSMGAGGADSGTPSAGEEQEVCYLRPKSSIKGSRAKKVVSSPEKESGAESEAGSARDGALKPVPVNVPTQAGKSRRGASKGGRKPTCRAVRAAPHVHDVQSSEESGGVSGTAAGESSGSSPVPQNGQRSTGKRRGKRVVSSPEEGASEGEDTESAITLDRPTAAAGATCRAPTRTAARGAAAAPRVKASRPRNPQRRSRGDEVEVARAAPEDVGVERQRDMGLSHARIASERLAAHGVAESRPSGGLGEWAQWAGLADSGMGRAGGEVAGLGSARDGAGRGGDGPLATLAPGQVDMKAMLPFLASTGLTGGRGCIPWGWTCAAAQQLAHCLLQQAKLHISSGQLAQAVVCALRAFSILHRASAAAVAEGCKDAGHSSSSHKCTCGGDCSAGTTAGSTTKGSAPALGKSTRPPCLCCCSCCCSWSPGEASKKPSQGGACAFAALEAEGALDRAAAAIPQCKLRPEFAALHAAVLLTLSRIILRASASTTATGKKRSRTVAPAPPAAAVVWDMGKGEATVDLGHAHEWLLAATWRAQHRPLLFRSICRELTTLTAASLHGAAYPWHPHNSLSAPTAGEGGIPRSSLALMLHSEAMGVTPGLQHALQLTEIVDVAAEDEEESGKTSKAGTRGTPEPSKDPAQAALLLAAYQPGRWGSPDDVANAAGRAAAMVEAFPSGYAVCHMSTAASGALPDPGGPGSSLLVPHSRPCSRQPQLVITRASSGRPVVHALLPTWSPGTVIAASGAGESADNTALLQEPGRPGAKKGPGRKGSGQGRKAAAASAAAAAAALDVGLEELQEARMGSVAVGDILGRFGALMEDSTSSMKGVKDNMGRAEMERWWQWRIRLDQEMQQLVSDMELSLLGPWVCLLLGEPLDASVVALCEQHSGNVWASLNALCPPHGTLPQEDTAAAAQGAKSRGPQGRSAALESGKQAGGSSEEDWCMGREMVRLLLQAHAMSVIGDRRLQEGLLDVAQAQSQAALSIRPKGGPAARSRHERAWRKGAEEALQACIASFKAAAAELPRASGALSSASAVGEDEPLSKRGRGKASSKAQAAATNKQAGAGAGGSMRAVHQPVQLILDSTIQCLPWECMPSLLTQRVYRAPSLGAMRALLLHHRNSAPSPKAQKSATTKATSSRRNIPDIGSSGVSLRVDPLQTFYVVNPGADLKNTQKEFETWFGSVPTWKGLAGRAPSAEEFKASLDACSLFVYCGHGTGEQYFRANSLHKLRSGSPATLLMGCSSGRLRPRGDYEPVGVPMHYVTSGCPALVGNLWDVTDKDIDGFCRRVLEGWLGDTRGQALEASTSARVSKAAMNAVEGAGAATEDFSELAFVLPDAETCVSSAVATQRSGCKMRYLIGAALVCYGMPAMVLQGCKEAAP